MRAPTFYQRCRDQQWYINQLQTVQNQYISQINESKQRLAAEISRNAVAATLGATTDPNMITSKSLHTLPTISSPTPGMGDNYAVASTSQSTPKRGPSRNQKIFSALNKSFNSSISSGRSSTKSAQAGDSTDTSTNSVPLEDSSCSSTSSASSVQTRVKVGEKLPVASDAGTDSATGEAAGSPRHLLELRVSLSSPNLLHSSVAFTVSSSSSEAVSVSTINSLSKLPTFFFVGSQ